MGQKFIAVTPSAQALLPPNKSPKIVSKISGVYLMYLSESRPRPSNRDPKCPRKLRYAGTTICVTAAKVPSLKSFSAMSHFDWIWTVSSNAALNALNFCRTRSREPLLLDEDPFSPSLLRCWSTCCHASRWYFNAFVDTCTVLKNWNDTTYCVQTKHQHTAKYEAENYTL